jgi:hypothetical protein
MIIADEDPPPDQRRMAVGTIVGERLRSSFCETGPCPSRAAETDCEIYKEMLKWEPDVSPIQ